MMFFGSMSRPTLSRLSTVSDVAALLRAARRGRVTPGQHVAARVSRFATGSDPAALLREGFTHTGPSGSAPFIA